MDADHVVGVRVPVQKLHPLAWHSRRYGKKPDARKLVEVTRMYAVDARVCVAETYFVRWMLESGVAVSTRGL